MSEAEQLQRRIIAQQEALIGTLREQIKLLSEQIEVLKLTCQKLREKQGD